MRVFVILFILFLSACSLTPAQFNKSNISKEKLAILEVEECSRLVGQCPTYIKAIYTLEGEKVVGYTSPFEQDIWDRAYLEPGVYHIIAYCNYMSAYAHPKITFMFEESKKYVMNCEENYGKDFIGLKKIDSARIQIKEVVRSELVEKP